jgi:cell division topological specificity factor
MSLINFLKQKLNSKPNTAELAKERLQIIVAHQRNQQKPEQVNLNELQLKLIKVISEYLKIDEHLVNVELQRDADRSLLEMNVTLPEQV